MESKTNERRYAELVSGLLGARTDPVTERFDEELDRAVADGEVSAGAARRLRFWQRSSLRALTDHTRTVLPITLGALEAARHDAMAYLADLDELDAAEAPDAGDVADVADEADEADATDATPTPDTPPVPSTITLPEAVSLEGSTSRLLVAGLVTTVAPDMHLENR